MSFMLGEWKRSPLQGGHAWGARRPLLCLCTLLCAELRLAALLIVFTPEPAAMLPHPLQHCNQVLDTLVYAERELLRQRPELAAAQVYVHFQSSVQVGDNSCNFLRVGSYKLGTGRL